MGAHPEGIMTTHPYLHFQGCCAEAMAAYAEILGGTDLRMLPYSAMPGGDARPGADGRIMHAELSLGSGRLMASDFPPGMEGDAQAAVSIMQAAPDVGTASGWFDRLAEGGAVIQPFGPTFFSPGFGMVKDRFGTHWIISTPA